MFKYTSHTHAHHTHTFYILRSIFYCIYIFFFFISFYIMFYKTKRRIFCCVILSNKKHKKLHILCLSDGLKISRNTHQYHPNTYLFLSFFLSLPLSLSLSLFTIHQSNYYLLNTMDFATNLLDFLISFWNNHLIYLYRITY